MQDKPDGKAILRQVQAALKAGIAPGFQQSVAANAIALVLREDDLAGAGHDAERKRLAALLGRDGDVVELNRALATGIRDGSADVGRADATAHLIRSTIEKMAVDQPNYPAFHVWKQSAGD